MHDHIPSSSIAIFSVFSASSRHHLAFFSLGTTVPESLLVLRNEQAIKQFNLYTNRQTESLLKYNTDILRLESPDSTHRDQSASTTAYTYAYTEARLGPETMEDGRSDDTYAHSPFLFIHLFSFLSSVGARMEKISARLPFPFYRLEHGVLAFTMNSISFFFWFSERRVADSSRSAGAMRTRTRSRVKLAAQTRMIHRLS